MSAYIEPKLAAFILAVWDEGNAMRAAGASMEAKQEHWRDRVLTYAKRQGLVVREEDLPPWMLRSCAVCNGNTWAPTIRQTRNGPVDAVRRCDCQAIVMAEHFDDGRQQAERRKRVSESWNRK